MVGTYLNFPGNTEEAFLYYQTVFGGEFLGGISRFGDAPPHEDQPPMPEHLKNMVMHIALPILGGHLLMGSDSPREMGLEVRMGNNVYICLNPDSRAEAERIYQSLSVGGKIEMELQDTFWDAYFGSFTDKFGVLWMINCHAKV